MKWTQFIIIFAFLAVASFSLAGEYFNSEDKTLRVPSKAAEALSAKYGVFRYLNFEEFDPLIQKLHERFPDMGGPMEVSGDFNGDGKKDLIVLGHAESGGVDSILLVMVSDVSGSSKVLELKNLETEHRENLQFEYKISAKEGAGFNLSINGESTQISDLFWLEAYGSANYQHLVVRNGKLETVELN